MSSPVKSQYIHRTGSSKFRAGVSEMQGWRVDHEDAFACKCEWEDGGGLFVVLDGHGGSKSSRWASEHLVTELSKCEDRYDDVKIQDCFKRVDEALSEYLNRDGSGSTCVCTMVLPSKTVEGGYTVKVANLGDSRCLLGHRAENGQVQRFDSTEDHKPENPEERARIEAAGGFVSARIPARLDGVLSLSRALGDFSFKQNTALPWDKQRCSACPTMYTWEAKPGDCMLLACDGIFDVLSNNELIQEVERLVGQYPDDLGRVAQSVITKCLALNSQDNMTMMVVEMKPGEDHVRPDECTLGDFKSEVDDNVKSKYHTFAHDHGFKDWPNDQQQ